MLIQERPLSAHKTIMHLSVVIPIYNEFESIDPLIQAVENAVGDYEYEMVLVDDGSTDGSVDKIKALNHPRIHLVEFARNYGQTSAMAAGIQYARGEFIATMDADLQNDPTDIPAMLQKLHDEQLDVVVGWRKNRKDGMILRKIPSKIANILIRKVTNVHVHDLGCTLKIFRSSIAKKLDLYGELHRFIPILSSMYGAKIGEMAVKHHPRRFGTSKYGISRTLRVASDLLLMFFFLKYRQRPMHLFGMIGIGMFMVGGLIQAYLLMLKLFGEDIGGRPLFYVGILLIIMAVQFITAGFLSELMMRTYFESQNKRPYSVKTRSIGSEVVES